MRYRHNVNSYYNDTYIKNVKVAGKPNLSYRHFYLYYQLPSSYLFDLLISLSTSLPLGLFMPNSKPLEDLIYVGTFPDLRIFDSFSYLSSLMPKHCLTLDITLDWILTNLDLSSSSRIERLWLWNHFSFNNAQGFTYRLSLFFILWNSQYISYLLVLFAQRTMSNHLKVEYLKKMWTCLIELCEYIYIIFD